jgi:hypothetical protein
MLVSLISAWNLPAAIVEVFQAGALRSPASKTISGSSSGVMPRNVLEVTNEQLEATVLDFLDANTPKLPRCDG